MRVREQANQEYNRALHALTYTTLDGRVLDLLGLNPEERAYLAHCYVAYRSNKPWSDFGELAAGVQHPRLRDTGGKVTRDVWEHPLYQATSDLEDRLGIKQRELDPDEDDDPTRDPIGDALPALADASPAPMSGRHI